MNKLSPNVVVAPTHHVPSDTRVSLLTLSAVFSLLITAFKSLGGDTRMSYLIVYDIKRLDHVTRLKVNRRLRKLGASKLQHSVWELSDFQELNDLMLIIKSAGGKALVLEKKIVTK
jgi:hypothetical protein